MGPRAAYVATAASIVLLSVAGTPAREQVPSSALPGARVMLDAHNAYPYNGRFQDRIDRAIATGVPVAIEQDLVWRPAADGRPARSIVSHGEPYDGSEPSLREYFFERIRPMVEPALTVGNSAGWPLIVLNLDLKSNEPEHHRALWDLLGEYEAWLTTARRTADGSQAAPLDVKPVLVLTGESDTQAQAFHDAVPVGGTLRLFGAIALRPPAAEGMSRDESLAKFREALPDHPLPQATNYRRWWNAPWAVVEAGGQAKAAEWTPHEDARLRALVRRAHEAGLWIRLWTLNGHPAGEEKPSGWSTGYNVGSKDAVERRWRAAIAAGTDFIATDQYEAFAAALKDEGRAPATVREIVLEGTLTAANRLAWLERPFDVAPGTSMIHVETSYTDRDQGTAIEFGLYDPVRFRGASRTSKTRFFVSRTAATPSYQAGDLPAGSWRLLLGVPSIRDGAPSAYRVVVRMTGDGPSLPTPLELPSAAAATGARWYQGDLHSHTMHSDGFGCADGGGSTRPCAAHLIADAAARRGLDFVAVTDHNTTSHHHGMVEVQARHEKLLLMRGQEVTTFFGHANVFGTSDAVDFRIGHAGRTTRDLLLTVRRLGALISINHPGRETGERCTGCGWNAPATDYSLVDAMEVVNGRVVSGPTAGQPLWHARLNEGHRLTGVGGGDDHAAATRTGSGIGTPTTVVYAKSLTESGLLAGIRAGRVYIKVRGPEGPDVRLMVPDLGASMGDVVPVPAVGRRITFCLEIEQGAGQYVDVIQNGHIRSTTVSGPIAGAHATIDFALDVAPGDWVRVNLRDEAGITAIANPVYFR